MDNVVIACKRDDIDFNGCVAKTMNAMRNRVMKGMFWFLYRLGNIKTKLICTCIVN